MLTVDVPLNTMLADLDETLARSCGRSSNVTGSKASTSAFEAPAREWSGQLSKPTVNIFLYDLREAETLRTSEWSRILRDGRTFEGRPPMIMECSNAVTAWTQAVEDEHACSRRCWRSSTPTRRSRRPRSTGGSPTARSSGRSRPASGRARARSRTSGAAIGGQYKVSLDYVVRLSVDSGAKLERGPEVRTQTVRTRLADGPPRAVVEMHRSVGKVSNKKGEPAGQRVGHAPGGRDVTASSADGRFRFDRLPPRPSPAAGADGGRRGSRHAV